MFKMLERIDTQDVDFMGKYLLSSWYIIMF